MSLQAWAKWTLSHHSRELLPRFRVTNPFRFAQHHTFLFLIYDVLQRRQAALGNSIVVKRKDWESGSNFVPHLRRPGGGGEIRLGD